MAWRSHGVDNESLISALERNGIIRTQKVSEAMRRVDRANYCPAFSGKSAYVDAPLSLGVRGATISAPHMHAHCLEILAPVLSQTKHPTRVLDVGSGSGYLTACFAMMIDNHDEFAKSTHSVEVEDKTTIGLSDTVYPIIVGIDNSAALVERSKENLRKDGKGKFLEHPNPLLFFTAGDGRNGFPLYAPYDVIHCGAASPEKPTKLLEQLAPGGRAIVPVGKDWQSLIVYDKDENGVISEKSLMGVSYVPLTSIK